MKTRYRVGVVGFGLSSRHFHLPLLKAHPGFEVAAVSTSRAAEAQREVPTARIYPSADELIADPSIDLVINCAPNTAHVTVTSAALRAHKHVVVEKPFVNSTADGEMLSAEARENNRSLTVFHNRRWDGDFLTVQRLIKEDRLGKIKYFESSFDRFRPSANPTRWREQEGPGSGTWFDLGSHLVDQMLVLFGRPDSVFADIARQRDHSQADDYFNVTFRYREMRVVLKSSMFSARSPRFQIFGERAAFTKFGFDPQEKQMKEGVDVGAATFGYDASEPAGTLIIGDSTAHEIVTTERGRYGIFYDQLFQNLSAQAPLPVSPTDALLVISILEAAKVSSEKKQLIEF